MESLHFSNESQHSESIAHDSPKRAADSGVGNQSEIAEMREKLMTLSPDGEEIDPKELLEFAEVNRDDKRLSSLALLLKSKGVVNAAFKF